MNVEVIAYHFVALHIDIELGYTLQPSHIPDINTFAARLRYTSSCGVCVDEIRYECE